MKKALLTLIVCLIFPSIVIAGPALSAAPIGPVNFETLDLSPIQFNVKDITITSDGRCKVRSVIGPYANSPCEKIYGVKATSNSTAPASSTPILSQ